MQKIFFKLAFSAFLSALFVLAPDVALAADGNVFSIIANKMVSTVKDVRNVVYVLAGFGLIVFAVMAIFNKISFKHLGYICIGLFLLSVMMPFINYFSGAQLKDELVYGNHQQYNEQVMEELASLRRTCETDASLCPPTPADGEDPSQSLDDKLAGLTPPELSTPQNTPFDANGCRMKDGKQECCKNGAKGVNKKGTKCKLTFDDVLQGARDAGAMLKEGLTSAQKAKDMVEGAVDNAKKVADAAKNIGDSDGFLDAMGNLAALGEATNNMVDQAASSGKQALGSAGRTFDNFVDMNDDFTATKDSDRIEGLKQAQEKTDQALDKAADAMGQAQKASDHYVGDSARSVRDAGNTAGVVQNKAEDLGNWFGGGG